MHSKRKWQEEDDMDDDSSVEEFDDDTDVDVSDDDSDLEEPDLKRSLSTMTWPLHHSTTSVQQAGPNYRYLTRSHKDWTEKTDLEEKLQSNQSGLEVLSPQATNPSMKLDRQMTTPSSESSLHHGTEQQDSHR